MDIIAIIGTLIVPACVALSLAVMIALDERLGGKP